MSKSGVLALLLAASFAAAPARAEESLFAYTYTTDLLPKGRAELEQWVTWRRQKSQGSFDVVEGRTGLEYGLSDRLQGAVYLNYARTRAHDDGVDGTTFPPESFAEVQPGAHQRLDTQKFQGVSLEAVYRVLSPYVDPVGLAFLAEPTVGKALRELELRTILQKNWLEDRLVLGVNALASFEGRGLPGDKTVAPDDPDYNDHWDHETDLNFTAALSYRFRPNWSAGLEFMNEREFSAFEIGDDKRTNSAFYWGPNIHYGGKRFFATATALEQLPWGSDYANPAPGSVRQGRNYADDFERYRLRVKAGWYFN
jgi:hypothetical protein